MANSADNSSPSIDLHCEHCGRPHGQMLRCLPDGRWLSPDNGWIDANGDQASWPDVVDYARLRHSRAIVGLYRQSAAARMAAEVSHRLCRRCHLVTGREEHRRVARLRALTRFALGDLFDGTYAV
ncbi:hypothetical protein [Azospirillum palustre]